MQTDVLVSSEKTIITSHDALESDLLLSELLERVSKYNQNFPDEAIGVKLDFKDPAAVSGSIDLVNKIWIGQKAPIWLNADILLGPGGKPSRFDAKQFIETAIKKMPNATLSLGWTTSQYVILSIFLVFCTLL